MVIDQVRDVNGTALFRLASLYPLPDFVKAAERTTPERAVKLASASFADRTGRLFPCHTRADTFLSHLYFLDQVDQYPTKQASVIRDNLIRMATVWNINGPYGYIAMLKESFEKRAADAQLKLTDDDYAIVEGSVKRFPMPNASCVQKAAGALYLDRDKYPYAWRKRAAQRILKRAEDMKAEIEADTCEYLHKAAGWGFSTSEQVSDRLHERAAALFEFPRAKESARELSKFAEEVRTMSMTPDLLEKLALFVDEMDRRTGMYRKYAQAMPTPEEVMFSTTEKAASEFLGKFVELANGRIFSREDLQKASADAFAAALGDDIETCLFDPISKRLDIEKAAEVLPTLPRDDADNLVNALGAAGITPVTKRAGHEKKAGLAYDQAMDLAGWKELSFKTISGVTPRVITRADEIESMKPASARTFAPVI